VALLVCDGGVRQRCGRTLARKKIVRCYRRHFVTLRAFCAALAAACAYAMARLAPAFCPGAPGVKAASAALTLTPQAGWRVTAILRGCFVARSVAVTGAICSAAR